MVLDEKVRFYAQSILDMALAENAADSLEQEFKILKEEIISNLDLKNFLSDPSIEKSERIKAAFMMLEGDYSKITNAILAMVIIIDVVKEIDRIYKAYTRLVSNFKKQLYVEVVSAIELNDETLARVKENVDRITGQDARIRNTINPEMLGGLMIKIGGKIIDLSVRGKLNDMRSKLKSIELRGEEFGTEN